jgi:hypothetical protein
MRNERLAVTLTIGNLLLLSALVTGAANPTSHAEVQEAPVLRTQRLEIVDDRGRIRSRINVESNGEVVLRMTDHTGTIRVKLGADENGSGLLLLDETTEPGVHLMARREGSEARRTTTSLTLRAGSRQQIVKP